MSTVKPKEQQSKRPSIRQVLRPYRQFVSLWILFNVVCSELQDLSFLLEIFFAVFQWIALFALPIRFRHSSYWVLMSVVGWIITSILVYGFQLGKALLPLIPGAEFKIIGLSTTAQIFWTVVILSSVKWLIIGFFQWLFLRRYIKRAKWWLLASAIAGLIYGFLELTINALGGGIWGAVVGGLGYGIVTSIALIWLVEYNFELRPWRYGRGGRI